MCVRGFFSKRREMLFYETEKRESENETIDATMLCGEVEILLPRFDGEISTHRYSARTRFIPCTGWKGMRSCFVVYRCFGVSVSGRVVVIAANHDATVGSRWPY